MLAARTPSLHGALLAAKAAGYDYVNIDGTLIETDRCRTPARPQPSICGGRANTISTAATSRSSPPRTAGRSGPPTCGQAGSTTPPPPAPMPTSCPPSPKPARTYAPLGDLGYEGLADTVTVAFKRPKNGGLLLVQQQFNKAHNSLRAIGERGNSLLKMTFRALRNVGLNPWRIGTIVAAALVILHIEHNRTTLPSVVSTLLGQAHWPRRSSPPSRPKSAPRLGHQRTGPTRRLRLPHLLQPHSPTFDPQPPHAPRNTRLLPSSPRPHGMKSRCPVPGWNFRRAPEAGPWQGERSAGHPPCPVTSG